MGTGVLSVAAADDGLIVLSWLLLVLALTAALVLGVAVVVGLLTDRRGWLADARTPASLTGVAASTVLGTRLVALGWTAAAWLFLALGVLLWLALLPLVLRHWQVPTVGASFLVCVAAEGLAVLLAVLGPGAGSRAAVLAAAVLAALGLVLYGAVLARFDWRQLIVGAGDQWVVAGALAISSLAGAELVLAGDRLDLAGSVRQPLRLLDLRVGAVGVIGSAVLLGCELRWPRWRYDIRRWATVFPMGMTAAASFAVAQAEGLPALAVFGDILMWPALAAWALTVVAAAGWLQGSRARRETKSSRLSAPSRERPSRRER